MYDVLCNTFTYKDTQVYEMTYIIIAIANVGYHLQSIMIAFQKRNMTSLSPHMAGFQCLEPIFFCRSGMCLVLQGIVVAVDLR